MVNIPEYCISLDSLQVIKLNFDNMVGGNWLGMVLLSLTAMAFFLLLMYMLSQLIRVPKVEAWSKFELFQVLITMVLAVCIAGWLYGMCHWDVSFLDYGLFKDNGAGQKIMSDCQYGSVTGVSGPTGEVTPFCVAQSYLKSAKLRGDDIYQVLMGISYVLSYIFKATWNSSPIGIGYSLDPLAGFQQLMNIFMVSVSGFIVAYISVLVQMRMLDFFLISMPFYFMPLGLLLRTFQPTREFGGAIMGVAITALFLYPMILVMDDMIVYSSKFEQLSDPHKDKFASIGINTVDTGTALNNQFGLYQQGATSSGVLEQKPERDTNLAGKIANFATPDTGTMTKITSNDMETLGATIFFPFQLVLIYSIVAVVLPIIDFIIFVEIARELTSALGTEVDLTNLTRLI